ncbi:MAG: exodeoxyribonuclease VII large subunit [Prevotella sp.]|nr:exodeoxyribonuclease VII large subunit [Prevotella sp.]
MFDLFSDNDFQVDANSSSEGAENALTLYELNSLVREVLETTLSKDYWVEAELSEVRESKGHCYMELVQFSSADERKRGARTPIARASAKCWQRTWMQLRPRFERVTGQPLHAGMKVLLRVHVNFHEAFGFAWIVNDIDPTYTMGDMARRRQEIIRQLKEEGVFDMQRELQLPMFCQRIAVISSATAAGYGDFCNQLSDNEFGLKFQVELFPAIMQGEQVEESIIDALNRIYQVGEETSPFDCVVIIRGGGATADLSGFDTLALAENVAQFPLSVITGIGHERDESVLDMVAHTRVKTPTAAAAFLIDHLAEVLTLINDCQDAITTYVSRRMQMEQMRLQQLAEKIPVLFSLVKTRQTARLDRIFAAMASLASQKLATVKTHLVELNAQLPSLVERRLLREQHRLDMLGQRLKNLDPELLLRRGYSITLKNGRALRNTDDLQQGDMIETRLANGSVISEVKKTKK